MNENGGAERREGEYGRSKREGLGTKTGQPSCFRLFNGKCEAIFVFLLENSYLGTNFKFNSC